MKRSVFREFYVGPRHLDKPCITCSHGESPCEQACHVLQISCGIPYTDLLGSRYLVLRTLSTFRTICPHCTVAHVDIRTIHLQGAVVLVRLWTLIHLSTEYNILSSTCPRFSKSPLGSIAAGQDQSASIDNNLIADSRTSDAEWNGASRLIKPSLSPKSSL